MQFKDLEFKPRGGGGIQARHVFPNGHGVSVIRGYGSYGNEFGLYELAVTDAKGHLDYSTPITSDVIGNLTEDEVSEILSKVEALDAKP